MTGGKPAPDAATSELAAGTTGFEMLSELARRSRGISRRRDATVPDDEEWLL